MWHVRLTRFLLRTISLIHAGTCAATGKRSYKHLVGADGSIKSVVRKGDAVIDAATLGPQKGKRMLVATGRHAGVKCVVRELDADGREGVLLCNCGVKYACSIALLLRIIALRCASFILPLHTRGRIPRIQESTYMHIMRSLRGTRAHSSGLPYAGMVRVRLLPSEHDVIIAADKLTEPGMLTHPPPGGDVAAGARDGAGGRKDQDAAHEQQRSARNGDAHERRNGGSDSERTAKPHNDAGKYAEQEDARSRASAWLREGIRVRVVDKDAGKGSLYLKKGTVLNVTGHDECSLQLESGAVREVRTVPVNAWVSSCMNV